MSEHTKRLLSPVLALGGLLCAFAVAGLLLGAAPSYADDDDDDDDDKISEFLEELEVKNVRKHQKAFQKAANRNDGTRASGFGGYDDSVDYVVEELEDEGYEVEIQVFDFALFEELEDAELQRITPTPIVDYPYFDIDGFATMEYSGSGDVTANTEGVDIVKVEPDDPDNTSNSGCQPEDFDKFTKGNIAVIQRGDCTFRNKALNAIAAGAVGVIIFNEGQDGRTNAFLSTLGGPGVAVPVVAANTDVGLELAQPGRTARIFVNGEIEIRTTSNVLAELPAGRDDDDDDDDDDGDWGGASDPDAPVIVVGAHLDSVTAGPGVQDNGSGSAAILEIALQLADEEVSTRNRIRFAWWGAEESGLIGSTFYVDTLPEEELNQIVANLNFDMIGSPNFVRFIYDGDGSAGLSDPGPDGSGLIEQLFIDHFDDRGLANEPTAFSGRSDYAAFIANDIPAGGLFTGAEGIKTEEQEAIYGGTAGEQYDPCYHLACDTFDNISIEALDQNTKAAADVMLQLADIDPPFVDPAPPAVALRAFSLDVSAERKVIFDYLGDKLQR